MLQLPAGDLQRLELVGKGGFGNVYRGWSHTLRMDVAFKTIRGEQGSSVRQLSKDLMKERDVMHKANYTYVLRILGMYEKKEGNFTESGLVMEYMPHGSLHTLFDEIQDVPWALRFQILHQVALGMNYLHNISPPIIHRDLKPGNVLLNKHLDAQITDFGLSKTVGVSTSTAQTDFAGTLSYMCPEAFTDLSYKPTTAYDVYSTALNLMGMEFTSLIIKDETSGSRLVHLDSELLHCSMSVDPNTPSQPTFTSDNNGCSETTLLMFEEYKDEIDNSIRIVQDQLKKLPSSDEMMETIEELNSAMSYHDNA
ncbi:receptor-interacting serine/threonine-protein kinase 2-like [Discoglossus pictus]